MRSEDVIQLRLPALLTRLIGTGVWPTDPRAMIMQQRNPIVPGHRVRQFAGEESLICLAPPPFHTIAKEIGGAEQFWKEFGVLHQIDPTKAIIIADFGIGSDAPVVLNYALNWTDPPVYRLRWGANGDTTWVQGASGFDEFAAILGLTAGA